MTDRVIIQSQRVGSLQLCLALGCPDIGQARLDTGEVVFITWGRNLTSAQAEWFDQHTSFEPVQVGPDSYELILPRIQVALLMSILSDKRDLWDM